MGQPPVSESVVAPVSWRNRSSERSAVTVSCNDSPSLLRATGNHVWGHVRFAELVNVEREAVAEMHRLLTGWANYGLQKKSTRDSARASPSLQVVHVLLWIIGYLPGLGVDPHFEPKL